jgi:hypothetical protein
MARVDSLGRQRHTPTPQAPACCCKLPNVEGATASKQHMHVVQAKPIPKAATAPAAALLHGASGQEGQKHSQRGDGPLPPWPTPRPLSLMMHCKGWN